MSISKQAINIGAALAISAAGMVGTISTATADEGADVIVHCYGVNKCKGHNDCKTAENACKGHAKCKGHGYVDMPASSCDHIGGTIKKADESSSYI
jgi:uncharacterized membrane protein